MAMEKSPNSSLRLIAYSSWSPLWDSSSILESVFWGAEVLEELSVCEPVTKLLCKAILGTPLSHQHSVTSWLTPGPALGLQGLDRSKREGNGKAAPAWSRGQQPPPSLDIPMFPSPGHPWGCHRPAPSDLLSPFQREQLPPPGHKPGWFIPGLFKHHQTWCPARPLSTSSLPFLGLYFHLVLQVSFLLSNPLKIIQGQLSSTCTRHFLNTPGWVSWDSDFITSLISGWFNLEFFPALALTCTQLLNYLLLPFSLGFQAEFVRD